MASFSDIRIGSKIKLKNNIEGTVKYIGDLQGKAKNKTYFGIELKKKLGNNNGTIGGTSYFKCKRKYGKFVRRYDILNPMPLFVFSELCDRTISLVLTILFEYMDGFTFSNFCNVGNGLTRIVFDIDKHCKFSFKRMWKLFVSPHSENNTLKQRYKELNDFYEERIYHYELRDGKKWNFEFGVFKINNVKNKDYESNEKRAMLLLKVFVYRLATSKKKKSYMKPHGDDDCRLSEISVNPLAGRESLAFKNLVESVKLKEKQTKFIKTEQNATFNSGKNVKASIFYKNIGCYADIWDSNGKEEEYVIPFKRKYVRYKHAHKQLRRKLKEFLMPNVFELGANGVKQWFVLDAKISKYGSGDFDGQHSYIIGWISAQKIIIVGGTYASIEWEQDIGKVYSRDSDDYWSLSL